VAPAFAASADFAIDKPAHTPCPNLQDDFRCGIHAELRHRGFPGCTAYDCFGAGQRISQVTFGGVDWRMAPQAAQQMYAAFAVMRDLHELLWLLEEADRLVGPDSLGAAVRDLAEDVKEAAAQPASTLEGLPTGALKARVGELLRRVSLDVRGRGGLNLGGRDLAGRDLWDRDLRRADLRGAVLIGSDLRGVDLARADLLGADLRGARLEGADLSTALFLTRTQVAGARGNRNTHVPLTLARPAHW
jgi:uncharacterized protein YjbI with pentapeptide repeats